MMEQSIAAITQSLETLGKPSPWSADLKVSDEFLTPLFKTFFRSAGLYNLMEKSNFHVLAAYVPANQIDPEVPGYSIIILGPPAKRSRSNERSRAAPRRIQFITLIFQWYPSAAYASPNHFPPSMSIIKRLDSRPRPTFSL